jgi:hypothetical protein
LNRGLTLELQLENIAGVVPDLYPKHGSISASGIELRHKLLRLIHLKYQLCVIPESHIRKIVVRSVSFFTQRFQATTRISQIIVCTMNETSLD